MRMGLVPVAVYSLSFVLISASGQTAQSIGPILPSQSQHWVQEQLAQAYPLYQPQQLDQMLAPIALYPDPLLAQILMASTYPLEVVEAARWMQQGNRMSLTGAQLDAALQPIDWDPSVKSLVPFPQVLQMMNSNLEWTEALGDAFVAQQGDVTDSVQRLRHQAMAAQTLRTSPQETIFIQGGMIVIQPANPQIVYVPYYDPALVYGRWVYPDYPPVYFPPPPHYGFVAGPGIYFGLGFGIVRTLWGWNQWDWGRRVIKIDPDRYNQMRRHEIDHDNHQKYQDNQWRHDPSHRGGVSYGSPDNRQIYQHPTSPNQASPNQAYPAARPVTPPQNGQDRRQPDHVPPRQEIHPQQPHPDHVQPERVHPDHVQPQGQEAQPSKIERERQPEQRQPEQQRQGESPHEQRQQHDAPADNGQRDDDAGGHRH